MISTAERNFEQGYFQQNYPDYERQNPPRKLRYYREMIERFRTPDLPRRVHDIGCAFGRFLESMGPGWEPFGSDVSTFALERARMRLPRARFALRTQAGADWQPGTFGAVTAFDVAEHVPDLHALAAEVKTQLAPGGVFVLVVPVYDGLSGPVIRRLDKDPTHLHKWPRAKWLEWAGRHFRVEHWEGIVRYLLPTRQYLHVPTRLFRAHAPAVMIVCRKESGVGR
ncbi:MAG: class I SAM-dependent methyltransferase [Tepidisphaeraceae bacterium]